MKAKEGHSSLMDWAPLITCIGVTSGPWVLGLFASEVKEGNKIVSWISGHAWGISVWGIIAFLVYMLWHSFDQWDALNEKRKPTLVMSEVPINRNQFTFGSMIKLLNTSAVDVQNCEVALVAIQHKGYPIFENSSAYFTFQPSERLGTRCDIAPERPQMVNIIFWHQTLEPRIRPGTEIQLGRHVWNFDTPFEELCRENGEYFFKIIVTAKNMYPPIKKVLRFTYADEDSKLEVVGDWV